MWLNYTRACKHCAADDEKCDMISLLHDCTLIRALGLLMVLISAPESIVQLFPVSWSGANGPHTIASVPPRSSTKSIQICRTTNRKNGCQRRSETHRHELRLPSFFLFKINHNLKSTLTSTRNSVTHGSRHEPRSVIRHSMMFATRDLKRQFWMPHNHVVIRLIRLSSVIDRLCDMGQFANR